MKLKKIVALVLALVLCLGAFAACDSGSGKTVNVNAGMEPTSLNTMTGTYSIEFTLFRHLYENLLVLDENDVPQPGAAESYTVSDDGLVYTFKMRQDGKWTNGETVTANDFAFAWKTVLDPNTAADYAQFLFMIDGAQEYYNYLSYEMDPDSWEGDIPAETTWEDVGVKVEDDWTLVVTLAQPTAYAPHQFTFGTFCPVNQKFYEEVGADKYGTEAEYFCTNGAYKLTEWTHDSLIVTEKFADYHGAADIAIDKINWKIITDPQVAVTEFLSGNLDMVGLATGELIAQVEEAGYETYSYSDGAAFYIYFNHNDQYLSNANLRQALALGFDKQAMIDTVWKTASQPMTSFTSSAVVGFDGKPFADSVKEKYGELSPTNGDVEKAKEYLATALEELGCTVDDLSAHLSVDCGESATSQAEAQFYQEQWRQNLGIEITINPMQTKQGSDNRVNGNYCMSLTGWGPDYNDPMTFLDLWLSYSGNNDTGYANPEYDALIEAALTEVDLEKRQELFYEAEVMLARDLPVAHSWWRAPSYAVGKKLQADTVLRTSFQDISLLGTKFAE